MQGRGPVSQRREAEERVEACGLFVDGVSEYGVSANRRFGDGPDGVKQQRLAESKSGMQPCGVGYPGSGQVEAPVLANILRSSGRDSGGQSQRPADTGARSASGGEPCSRVQAVTTGIFPIFACHSAGPVWCTEVPFESTATVTGMSCTSNS